MEGQETNAQGLQQVVPDFDTFSKNPAKFMNQPEAVPAQQPAQPSSDSILGAETATAETPAQPAAQPASTDAPVTEPAATQPVQPAATQPEKPAEGATGPLA